MKSNFKLAPNKNTEDDELFSPQDSAKLKSSREFIEGQKLAHLAPSTAHRQQPMEQFAEIAEYPQTSNAEKRENVVTSGAQYIVQSSDNNRAGSRQRSRASQGS